MTGLDAIRDPRERAEQVGPAVKPVADRIDWMPKDPETLVRIEGALSLGTGALLLTGRFRRLTTLLLAAQLIPTLATEHRYWSENDPERRASERSHLLKNAALFGALLMSATEPRRPPRTAELRRAMHDAQVKSGAEAKAMRREAAATLREARREAARQVRVARAEGGRKAAKTAAKTSKMKKAPKPGAMLKAGKAGKGGLFKAGKAGGALSKIGAAGAFKAGRSSGKASGTLQSMKSRGGAAGKTVKAGTATQAAKAMKAGKTVKSGTAVQAGKVLEAVKR